MSTTVSFRLPETTAEWLKATARRAGRSVNEVGAQLLEEARRIAQFGEIEFRSFQGERQACIKGHLQVWQLIQVAQHLTMDVERTAAHFGWPGWKVQAGFNYYEAFREEIDQLIQENRSMDFETLRRLLPQIGVIPVDLSRETMRPEEAFGQDGAAGADSRPGAPPSR